MRLIDSLTLVLVIVGGLLLGIRGLLGADLFTEYLGDGLRIAQIVIGGSALWQIFRQISRQSFIRTRT